MIIGSCGYGATGSSVVTDLLREYDGIQILDDFEFIIPYRVDGLEDLEYHLMKQYAKGESSDVAIRRFLRRSKSYEVPFIHKPCDGKKFYKLSKEFIDEITQFRFRGLYTADTCTGFILRDIFAFAFKKIFIPKVIEKIIKHRSFMWPCKELYFSIEPKIFYSAAKKYTNGILKAAGLDLSKPICLDQPFSGNSPEKSFPFFDDPYAIVIDKDPRDLYLAGKYTKDPNFKFSPVSDVDQFILYYRKLRLHRSNDPRILRLKFEDMIYHYDENVAKIEQFLGLGKHVRKKQIFDPSKSINNTQQIRIHPNEIMNIRKIEEALPEFLYPFEKYKDVQFTGKPFDGAARKAFEQ